MWSLALRVPSEPASLAAVRAALARWLDEIGLAPEVAFGVVTACSEVVSNAIEHAEAPREPFVELEAGRSGELVLVRVRDFGRWREPRFGSDRNHGLLLVSGIMSHVDIQRGPDGTVVTMRLDLADAAARRSA